MKRVALITCRILPEPDPDQDLLLDALRSRGMDAEMLPWDVPASDPGKFDLCVMRSCWNYYEDPDAFVSWIATAARVSRLVNDERVVHWNLHKTYLRVLRNAGVPIVPTAWFERGEILDLGEIMRAHGWDDVVIKPTISASSFRTHRFRRAEVADGQTFLETLVAERDVMVQRYASAVETSGERALVWIDGGFTHSVRKNPRLSGQDEHVSQALPVSPGERAVGEKAIACAGTDGLVYARVDVVEHEGQPVVSEMELMEPSLFLLQHPPALERFVAAIARL